jgi:hypothetical protein
MSTYHAAHATVMSEMTSADHSGPIPRTPSYARIILRTPSASQTIPETDFSSFPIALSSPSTIRADCEDFEMADEMAHETSISPVASPAPTCHFANLGLNRKHSSDRKLTAPQHIVANDAEVDPPLSLCPGYVKFFEEDDLSDLEELMVPEEMRSSKLIRDSQPYKEIKKSK